MKTLFTIITIIIISVKGLGMAFDSASNEVRQDALNHLDRIEQVAK